MLEREIDGKQGIFATSTRCASKDPVYVAVYPMDYYFDGPGGTLLSGTMAVVSSTFDQEATEKMIGSINITQKD